MAEPCPQRELSTALTVQTQTCPLQGSFLEATLPPVERMCFLLPRILPGEITPFMKTPLRAICFQGSGPTQAGSLDTHGRHLSPQVRERQACLCSPR